MKLERIKHNLLSRCKDVIISKKFVIGFTGKKVIILNSNFEFLKEIEGLKYAYNGIISPDEKFLLVVSYVNYIYLIDLQTMNIIFKEGLKGTYNDNLFGKGCWSFDGKSFYICPSNIDKFCNTLRKYTMSDLSNCVDVLEEKYMIYDIIPVEKIKKYLLIGYNQEDDYTCLIWYNEKNIEEYIIENYVGIPSKIEYDEKNDHIIIYEKYSKTLLVNKYGKIQIKVTVNQTIKFSLSDVFDGLIIDSFEQEKLLRIIKTLGLENIKIEDGIVKILMSSNSRYLYVATNFELFIVDLRECEILRKSFSGFVIIDLLEFDQNRIAVVTNNTVKLYELI